jgi:hypothetical protein
MKILTPNKHFGLWIWESGLLLEHCMLERAQTLCSKIENPNPKMLVVAGVPRIPYFILYIPVVSCGRPNARYAAHGKS